MAEGQAGAPASAEVCSQGPAQLEDELGGEVPVHNPPDVVFPEDLRIYHLLGSLLSLNPVFLS